MDEFFKDKDIEYKIFVANQVYPDSVSGFNRGTSKNVAYDIGSYRSAPPGLRIWGGPTINPNDIKLLLPWLQWAFEDTYKLVKKGN